MCAGPGRGYVCVPAANTWAIALEYRYLDATDFAAHIPVCVYACCIRRAVTAKCLCTKTTEGLHANGWRCL